MKAATSTLNPYAESYVPLSKRRGADERNDFKYPGGEAKRRSEATISRPQQWDPTIQASQAYNSQYADAFYPADNTKLKGYTGPGYHGSSSYSPAEKTDKATLDEESDMDLAYLLMTFPGVAEQSLSDAYQANNYDLDATIDMLTHLESFPVDSTLPDTLDIGDVPESGSAGELTSQKLKDLNIEDGASSSGFSGTAVAN